MTKANPQSQLLQVENLRTVFEGSESPAVDGVQFDIAPGRTLGLVGESGSGKSVTSLSVLGLLPETAQIVDGRVSYFGRDLVRLPKRELRRIRGAEISMIFQEPGTALNPVFKVGGQVAEAIRAHENVSRRAARDRVVQLFREVGMPEPERRLHSYPHELSGGQKQRVMIAMALACGPRLLIADEPTTALDVTIQAQILDLLRRLRDERGMAMLFITHDLGVIDEIADDVAVMYRGRLVEQADVVSIFDDPQHAYTRGLLACRPRLDRTFHRLPMVEDFLPGPDGQPAGPSTATRLRELTARGRGRLLHSGADSGPDSDPTWIEQGKEPLVAVRGLKVHFAGRGGWLRSGAPAVRAVDDVSFEIYPAQTLGLVGESGCGKTTIGRAILQLTEVTAGQVLFDGVDLAMQKGRALRRLRRRFQLVFQDPYASLNPRMRVEALVTEPMSVHGIGADRAERRDRAVELLTEVGLEASHLRRYPHEFSGGQRQRIAIARALAVDPEFLICDECVSALDVSVQAQVLNLLKDLQETRGLTYLFISHDLSVVKFMADMIAVMRHGKIVEFGAAERVYASPQEPYTRELIAAVPDDSLEAIRARVARRAGR
ncbi:MAG: ABC transporter ATP-binding protein [Acidobacteria bacterium]|nr:ABC transporter ATP-binding protein [Acidobacteriota bacterium]